MRRPHPVDRHVGQRIRLRRMMLGLTQKELGKAIRRSFQQIQQYEQGTNWVTAGTLYTLTRVLDVPIVFFFEDAPGKRVDVRATFAAAKGESWSGRCRSNSHDETRNSQSGERLLQNPGRGPAAEIDQVDRNIAGAQEISQKISQEMTRSPSNSCLGLRPNVHRIALRLAGARSAAAEILDPERQAYLWHGGELCAIRVHEG